MSTNYEMLPDGESFKQFVDRLDLLCDDNNAVAEYTGSLAVHRQKILEQSGLGSLDELLGYTNCGVNG